MFSPRKLKAYNFLGFKNTYQKVVWIHASMYTYYACNANKYNLKYKRESVHIPCITPCIPCIRLENEL